MDSSALASVARPQDMGAVALAVLLVLLFLSIASLAIAIERSWVLARARRQSLAFARLAAEPLALGRAQSALELARRYPASHLARVVSAGLAAYEKKSAGGRLPAPEVAEAAERAVERAALLAAADLQRGLSNLATIASTAPFVGLFGTVLGIIHAFERIAKVGGGDPAAISQGIAEALVATALGLFVAIPAAWMFNHLTHRIERLRVEMANSSSEMTDFIREALAGGEGER
jgi:biopolymer transport protein ExbB/TolQ